jgi:hypothetical protein
MASSITVGTPVYWVEEVHDRSLLVNELSRRRAPTKEVKIGRITVDGTYPKLESGTVITPISEEDYRGLNTGNINSENLQKKYPVSKRGGKKRRSNRTRRRV